jgi:hypothetical protein
MPGKHVLLAALIAPGSIEAAVGSVQSALFSVHGLASAQALPPLVPVAFLDAAAAARGLLPELNRSVAAGWRMRLAGALWVEGHLYAGVESDGAWQTLRACALEMHGPETGCLFPVVEGFYLGCGESRPEDRPGIRPAIPEASFSSCTIALVGVRTASDGSAWWRDLSWEVLEERPLRGRKDR